MEDNRLEMSRELEEMRQQFVVLKDRFERQEIVTDRLLRETQKKRLNTHDWLNLYIPMVVVVIMSPILYLCYEHYGLPLWVAVSGVVFAVTSIIVHYCERRKHREVFKLEGDVRQIAECVRDFRKRMLKLTIVGAFASIAFLAVAYIAWLSNVQLTDDPFRWVLAIMLLVVTFAAVVAVEIKSMRILDNIINDFE